MKKKQEPTGQRGKEVFLHDRQSLGEYLNNPRDTRTEANKRMWYGIIKGK